MAVYTHLTDEEVGQLLKLYDIGEFVNATGIAEGVENSNYLLVTSRGKYILTLYEKRVNEGDLPFFLGMMEWLADRGISCPRPLHGREGKLFHHFKERACAIVTFLDGRSTRNIRSEHTGLLGENLARMHLAGEGFTLVRKNALGLDGWQSLFEAIGPRADEIAPGLYAEMKEELAYLSAQWPANLPAGLIHADLFPDNVFFDESGSQGIGCSGVIDFYFACCDLLMYDLAICINAWCFDAANEFNVTRARNLLHAYHQARPISENELNALPVIARGAAMRFLLTRAYDWLNPVAGALVKPKNPLEYLQKLRFHQRVKHHGEYGL